MRHYAGRQIIEVQMSEAQFAQFRQIDDGAIFGTTEDVPPLPKGLTSDRYYAEAQKMAEDGQ